MSSLFIKIFKTKNPATARFIIRKIRKEVDTFHHFKTKPIRRNHHNFNRFIRENQGATIAVIGLSIISLFNANHLENSSELIRASLIGQPPIEFTGTVTPIEKIPNWVKLSDAERQYSFNQIATNKLMPLPEYNISDFKKGQNSSSNDKARNAYISYPVPNLGNYALDGSENSGSHTGVDIKTLIGTPVRSIAAGRVEKVDNAPSGFGKYVVIKHPNVPNPENPGEITTLYSCYAHLSSTSVLKGDEVSKGQLIAKTGDTGMATTPHLHFQIDKASAPFHPFWPFTWDEVQKAGYNSYFDGVRYGVGKLNARNHTTHPMNFVVKYQNFQPTTLVASTDENIITEIVKQSQPIIPANPNSIQKAEEPPATGTENQPITKEIEKPKEVKETNLKEITPPPIKKEETKTANLPQPETVKNTTKKQSNEKLSFDTDGRFIPGENKTIEVSCENCVATAGIEISSTLRGLAEIKPNKLQAHDFVEGRATIEVKTDSQSSFSLIAKGDFGEVLSKNLKAQIFTDIPLKHDLAKAIVYCKNKGIFNGYPDGSFKPNNSLNRAEAVKILVNGNRLKIVNHDIKFSDVPKSEWFRKFVETAVKREIIKGYPDNTFRPPKEITRAEFLKIAILTAGFKPEQPSSNPFEDVPATEWFAPFFKFAKEKGLMKFAPSVGQPTKLMTRGEAAQIIYNLSKVRK